MRRVDKQLLTFVKLLSKENQEKVLRITEELIEEQLKEQRKFVDSLTEPLFEEQPSYNENDIWEIIYKFPAEKLWTFYDLDHPLVFPPDLMVKVEILDYRIYVNGCPNPKLFTVKKEL